jgi:hypothetical protein
VSTCALDDVWAGLRVDRINTRADLAVVDTSEVGDEEVWQVSALIDGCGQVVDGRFGAVVNVTLGRATSHCDGSTVHIVLRLTRKV